MKIDPQQSAKEQGTNIDITLKNGMKLAAKHWGDSSQPLVIALHGWLDNANSFDEIAPLMPQFQILALDLPGHGLSDHRGPDCFYYPWEDAIIVKEVMDIFEANHGSSQQKCQLIGHSAGGGVVTIVASIYPQKVSKIVLIDSAGLAFTTDTADVPRFFSSTIRRNEMAANLKMDGFSSDNSATFSSIEQAVNERIKGFSGIISHSAALTLTQRSIKKVTHGYRWRFDPRLVFQPPLQLSESHARAFISTIKAEALVLLGANGLFSNGQADERLACFNQATIEFLEGGHHLHLEKNKEQVAERLNAFLLSEPLHQ